MNTLQVFAAPLGRFLIAIIFFLSGVTKVTQYAGTQGYMESMGVPGALLPLVILTEVIGGVAIIIGWKTRYAAIALAGFSVLATVFFHNDFSVQAEMISFMKNLAIAGGFLMIFANGPGSYALDNRLKKKYNE
ncbi:transporter [Shewanella sediminis HAW-EB3]|uniref:Transporter n=1 Tax=Shewanella sediminis (strain HAW-EB3) TaxID=425104 RepID=A8FV87_SHESH|nr:DoxX family protein [Shewanella sediminis]ABV36760.1 transporter [Shewanella sediminis HAW-EB3]